MVTGCRGFLGSVLCARLDELAYNIIGIDNAARGLNDLSKLQRVTYLEFDLLDVRQRRNALLHFQPSAIFHLAAATGDLTRPLEELEAINVDATYQLFIESRSLCKNPPIFVYPTTSLAIAVPDSTYVQTKEKAVGMILEEPDSERAMLMRNFNICGSYRTFGEFRRMEVHLFPRIYKCFKTGEDLVINGNDYDTYDGTPSRDYAHVLDAMDFYIHCWGLKRGNRLDYPTTDGLLEMGRGEPATVLECSDIVLNGAKEWGIEGPGYQTTIGPRRNFDCGSLRCSRPDVIDGFRETRGWTEMLRDSMKGYEYHFQKTGKLYMKEDGYDGREYKMINGVAVPQE